MGTSNTNQARVLGVLWGSREDSVIQMRARGVRLIGREDLFTESEFIDGCPSANLRRGRYVVKDSQASYDINMNLTTSK